MSSADLADIQWLVSDAAGPWLKVATELRSERTLLQTLTTLRQSVSTVRARLLVDQVQLRKRAEVKFSQAAHMFFTDRALQQATDEVLAAYKTSRFPSADRLQDLCCGIGGDALTLARHFDVDAVDQDEIVTTLAQASADQLGATRLRVRHADVRDIPRSDVIHIDPDRRPEDQRATALDRLSPDTDYLSQVLGHCRIGAFKIAPASSIPHNWFDRVEREWVATRGECRQQIVWSGEPFAAGTHRATRVGADSRGAMRVDYSHSGHPDVPIEPRALGRYVFDPSPEILAAKLMGDLARDLTLAQPFSNAAYLTADHNPQHPALRAFEVLEIVPFHEKRLRRHLEQRGLGRVTVKKRGVKLDANQLQRSLANDGADRCVVLLAGGATKIKAVIARPA